MERRGEESDRGAVNRDIQERNAEQRQLAALEIEAAEIRTEIGDYDFAWNAAHTTEPVAPIYDRDAAEAEWSEQLSAAAITRDDAQEHQPAERAAQVEHDRPAAQGPYAELPQPLTKVERDFAWNAAHTTEPVAPIYDRDAAEAEWSEQLSAAAITRDDAQEHQPAERAAQVEHDRPAAQGPYAELPQPLTKVERDFAWNAAHTTEPVAPIYDRDAAEAEWSEQLSAAAITRDDAQEHQPAERAAQVEHDRPAAQGPYAELPQPLTKVERDFAWNAAHTTEPVAPIYDRDAAEAEWFEQLSAAAIAKDDAQELPRAGSPVRGVTTAKIERPLGKATGEIRLAWALSRPDQFGEALRSRGFGLARVTREEADASHRQAVFAKAVGNFSASLKEGEIVAVSSRFVFRLDERTTGSSRPEIQGRLVGIDRNSLTSVAEAKEAVRAAAERKRIERPLGKATGEIRLAWALSRADQLEEALQSRGFSLARVTREESDASYRLVAFAKAVGNFAAAFNEGEIVAVNGRFVFRLDERTTGKSTPEIEGRLVGIDRTSLKSVAEAKEAMRAVEREKRRPANWIEARIAKHADQARELGANVVVDAKGRRLDEVEALADRLKPEEERRGKLETIHGVKAFAARLAQSGIAIVRLDAADIVELNRLRADEEMARSVSEAYTPRRFAELIEGDLAAVMRNGQIHRLNPAKLGDAQRHLAGDLPTMTEARARFGIEREMKAWIWTARQVDADASSAERAEEAELRESGRKLGKTARGIARQADKTGGVVARAVNRLVELFKPAEYVLDVFDGGDPVLTPQQAKLTEQSAKERQGEIVAERIVAEKKARQHDLLAQIARDDAQKRLRAQRGESHELDQDRDRERERER